MLKKDGLVVMGWYELYKNNHYAGGMDFDYFAAVICNNKKLVRELKHLVRLHNEHKGNLCFVVFSRRLIEGVLTYFSEHTWSKQNNIHLSLSNGFLSCAMRMENIPENKNIILQAKSLNQGLLEGTLMIQHTKIDTNVDENVCEGIYSHYINSDIKEKSLFAILTIKEFFSTIESFRRCIWDENVRKNLVRIKSFLILCTNMPDILAHQEIRHQAKYLLINFVDGYIPEDVVRDVEALVLETK